MWLNTFGQGYVAGTAAQTKFPLYDVRQVWANRSRFRREMIEDLAKANSFECFAGRVPSTGWILMSRKDFNQLNPYSTTLQLTIGDPTSSYNVQPLNGLVLVQARCVTRGIANDPAAIYLVELTDRRGVLSNRWFDYPTLSAYNIRATAYPHGTFIPASMNGGTTWTWGTMIRNLWEQMPLLGTWPGMPNTPVGTPEGFWMTGVSAWDALTNILDHLGLQVAVNLTNAIDSQFTLTVKGANDSTFNSLTTQFIPNLEDDYEWEDFGAGRVPATVRVYFRRRNEYYGSEETVRYDTGQWNMATAYTVTVSTGFTSAVGVHSLWSDFTVRYDQDSQPVSADTTIAAAIALDRVTNYLSRIAANKHMTRIYAGALPFYTGSDVDSVKWYQDLSLPDQAWKTRISRAPEPYREVDDV